MTSQGSEGQFGPGAKKRPPVLSRRPKSREETSEHGQSVHIGTPRQYGRDSLREDLGFVQTLPSCRCHLDGAGKLGFDTPMRIDHLVWYNSDLAEGRRFFSERMDCQPLYGGEHPGGGTANAVMALGPETYLEILGRDPRQSANTLDAEVKNLSGSGLYHWAVGGVNLQRLAKRARLAGLEAGPLVPGGRVKPDGSWLGWTCWGLRDHGFGSLVPFCIDWRGNEHPAVSAPHGGKLASLEVHCPQPDELRRLFEVLDLAIVVKTSETPSVVAVLESEKGLVELRSFRPLPHGYVI